MHLFILCLLCEYPLYAGTYRCWESAVNQMMSFWFLTPSQSPCLAPSCPLVPGHLLSTLTP